MKNDITITRLREANPVDPARYDGADDLFDSIVAGPSDSRLSRRPTRGPRRRRAVAIAVIAAVMAVVASSAVAAYRELYSAPIVRPEVTKREFQRATHQLTLPPGTTWPDFDLPPDTVMAEGGGGSQAVMLSQVAWECYLADAIEGGDRAAQARAQAELGAILDKHIFVAPDGASETWAPQPTPTVPYAVFADDGGVQFKRQMYADAAAGNPRMLIQSCTVNSP